MFRLTQDMARKMRKNQREREREREREEHVNRQEERSAAMATMSSFREEFASLRSEFSLACDLRDRRERGRERGWSCMVCHPIQRTYEETVERAQHRANHLQGELLAVELMVRSITQFLLCLKASEAKQQSLGSSALPHVPRDIYETIVFMAKEKRKWRER